jgi:hypothetical protein
MVPRIRYNLTTNSVSVVSRVIDAIVILAADLPTHRITLDPEL